MNRADGWRLAGAPVTFGVWERTVDRPDLVARERLLEAAGLLGYRGLELGPPGYLGADAPAVREALTRHDLELAGAFAPVHLADEAAFAADVDELDRTLAVLAVDGGVAVLADAETAVREAAAGQLGELERTALDDDAFEAALERLDRAVRRCRAAGVRPVFHPHAGTYIETPAEIERMLAGSDVELCLDSGHLAIGGGDPVAIARRCAGRIAHLHLKDVDGAMLDRLRAGEIEMMAAWEAGLFCPLGEGIVDVEGFLAATTANGFDGWLVLEQDRVAVRDADLDGVRAVEERNLEAVRRALQRAAPA
jgi:inosose dehydratase